MKRDIRERLKAEVLLTDGAMGTLLVSRGAPAEGPRSPNSVAAPDLVREIHDDYVAAGAQVRFVAFPQGIFIGERLIVPSTIGPFFDIVDFRIANKPQTMAAGNVPAELQPLLAPRAELFTDTTRPNPWEAWLRKP